MKIAKKCPAGQVKDKTGKCYTPTQAKKCSADEELVDGKCIKKPIQSRGATAQGTQMTNTSRVVAPGTMSKAAA